MYFAIFTLITALTISVIAAWYSIIGLTAIFAAAFIPIVLMGGSLEVGKVVTAVWLHQNWHIASTWMKSYLTTATIVLMMITSMGIFGFLSKAHIEQTAASDENIAKIEQHTKELDRQQGIVDRSTAKITALETAGAKTDSNFQSQIDKEQERIDSAYDRIKPAIAEQQSIINSQTKLYTDQIAAIDNQLLILQDHINNGRYAQAQVMIGANGDGRWREKSVKASNVWKAKKQAERKALVTKVEQISKNNDSIIAARKEIKRLRRKAEAEIAQSNKLIDRLRSQIGKTETVNVDEQIEQLNAKITVANSKIEELTESKFKIESEYRKLEAEVGPIKYIAEFVYGEEADRDMLEQAVRWVIIMLIFVFDPLAICLILAGAQQLQWERKRLGLDVPKPRRATKPPVVTETPIEEKWPEGPEAEETDEPEPSVTSVEELMNNAQIPEKDSGIGIIENAQPPQTDMKDVVSSVEHLQAMLREMDSKKDLSKEEQVEREQIEQLLRRKQVTHQLRNHQPQKNPKPKTPGQGKPFKKESR